MEQSDKISGEDIAIYAISSDDSVRIAQLIDLFQRTHGEAYPVKAVYDPEFWRAQIELRMTSIVTEIAGQIVAHVAIKPDKQEVGAVQITLPVCDQQCIEGVSVIAKKYAALIRRQCRRNSWPLLYHYVSTNCYLSTALSSELFYDNETAVCPAYLLRGHSELESPQQISGTTVFLTQLIPYPEKFTETELYLPEKHLEICRKLYEPFGLERKFSTRPKPVKNPTARKAIHITDLRHIETAHIEVSPSLVGDVDALIKGIRPYKDYAIYLFLDLSDPFTPDFCDSLEKLGYRFSGVLPVRKGHDSLVLWKEQDIKFDSGLLYSARAKLLLEYLKHYDLNKALEIAGITKSSEVIFKPSARSSKRIKRDGQVVAQS